MKRVLDMLLSSLALLVLSPVMAGDRDRWCGWIRRGPSSTRGADRAQGAHVHLLQVPHHGGGCGPDAQADLQHMNERDGVLFKIMNDPRITKLGASCGSIRWTSCRSSSTC